MHKATRPLASERAPAFRLMVKHSFISARQTHIFIETDGRWFRVVEWPLDHAEPTQALSVRPARRGNGTRCIRAGGRD